MSYPFTIEQLMQVGDAITASEATHDAKDIAIFALLRMLAERESADTFPSWLALWQKVHASRPREYLVTDSSTYHNLSSEDCFVPDTLQLALVPMRAWGDDAITAWLASGLKFTSEQQRIALETVTRASTLSAAIKAGVDPNARSLTGLGFPQSPDSYPVMDTIAGGIGLRLNQLEPNEVADLVAEFKRQGTDLSPPGMISACDTFRQNEQRRVSEIANGISNTLPQDREEKRKRAVIRIQQLLCEK
jgi:hypothetical protein